MMTALAVLLIVALLAGMCCLSYQATSGCPFAWVWFVCGGLESAAKVIGYLLVAIITQNE